MQHASTRRGLDKYLSPLDVWAMAFGCMVGWGCFVMPGSTFLPVAGPMGTIIAMAIGMMVTLLVGAGFSYLMNHSPGTGGIYAYTKEAFGRDHAFLCSWFLCLAYLTIVFLNASALFIVMRIMLGNVFQTGYHYVIAGNDIYLGEVALSIFTLVAVGLLFVKAKALLQRLQTILSVVLLIGVILLSVVCVPHISTGTLTSFGTRDITPAHAVFTIVILSPWAFVGFDVTAFDTAHFNFSRKKTWPIIVCSIVATCFAYTALAIVSVSVIPDGYASWQEYIMSLDTLSGVISVPTFHAAAAIMGQPGLIIAAVTAMAAILTGIIQAYRASIRVLSTMAEDHILSEHFTNSNYSILFVMIISILIAFLGRNVLNWFVNLTSFGAVIGFGYTSAAAWKLSHTRGDRRISVISAIGTVITGAFAIVHLVPNLAALEAMGSESFLMLSLWCLLGFVFYWRTVNQSQLSEYSSMSTSGVVLFTMLLYTALMWFAKLIRAQTTVEAVHTVLSREGLLLLLIIFIGLIGMLYIQSLLRSKHEMLEREKIRAVESSMAKSQFLFNMSHDIRTPMNAIIGYTDLAKKEPSSPQQADYLNKIGTASQNLLDLINSILEMSRIESGKIELEYAPADLCAMFDSIRDLFVEQMKAKQLTFEVHTRRVQHPLVWCDQKNLNRVLLNIVSNAYKFTPEVGAVTVSLWESAGMESGYSNYELRVQDTGIGMSHEFAEKMFNAFERERTSTVSGIEGTGLGLAITKSIVDLMGGTIDVLTSPGNGTQIIIRLKLRHASEDEVQSASEKGRPAAPAEVDFSQKRLLLVEDNEINREIATMILTEAGFTVEVAENGQIAVDKVSASEPGWYDAILMDIQMPVMDGYEATRTIRRLENKTLAGIPIVAMTANAFKEDERAAAEAGMQGHIAKPIDVNRMLQTLREVLAGRAGSK